MAFLFLAFAGAMAGGTFIEHYNNTDTARLLVYNAWWFEGILLLLTINFLGNIQKYRLYRKQKWPILLLHLAFVLIMIGAFTTRYFGFEGTLSLREGTSSNAILSSEAYLQLRLEKDIGQGRRMRKTLERPLLLAEGHHRRNDFSLQSELDSFSLEVDYVDFIPNARTVFEPDPGGDSYLKIVDLHRGERHEHFIRNGTVRSWHGRQYAFNLPEPGSVNLVGDSTALWIRMPVAGNRLSMTDGAAYPVPAGRQDSLHLKSLYTSGDDQFIIPALPQNGRLIIQAAASGRDNAASESALLVRLNTEEQHRIIPLFGAKGRAGNPVTFQEKGISYTFTYGSKKIELPFTVRLRDFIADKYPGSDRSYASFESRVTVQDTQGTFNAQISMNNTLDHQGFRFFQSSFHPDEKGTILSVNHDMWGTRLTYIGYFLLYFGLILMLFSKHSRFGIVRKKLRRFTSLQFIPLLVFFFFVGMLSLSAQKQLVKAVDVRDKLDTIIEKNTVDPDHARAFGSLVLQDPNGRMKPVNTFTSELLRKIHKKDVYKQLNADQVFLSMNLFPQVWYNLPLIYLKRGNQEIRSLLNVTEDSRGAPLSHFFDQQGRYLIADQVAAAHQAAVPNQYQKDLIETDRRVNLLYQALSGQMLRIFPLLNDPGERWISHTDLPDVRVHHLDSLFIGNMLPLYLQALGKGIKTENYLEADSLLSKIGAYQKKIGGDVMPSPEKIKAEILYNRIDIFNKLFVYYLYLSLLLLPLVIIQMVSPGNKLRMLIKACGNIALLLFLVHSLGLVARWYIAGHAPWSDAYESMIYIGWASMLFGLILGRKSKLTIAAAAFVTSMILMIAHWNWLDPAIANLQPVLNSYWLMIHVAIIVASYGPFTLGMVLGVISLLLMVFFNENNHRELKRQITRISLITELSLTLGLVMLTIGNFLGGQWANESWGRYWGWDPKETWALISIVIYAFVIHMRLIPSLRSKWLFSLMSILAFYSILMTYFGVNFYLSGLHSYAQGDRVVTPLFVYYSLAGILILAVAARLKHKKFDF